MRRDFLSKSHRSDLNRGPTLYESVALPTELRRRVVANSDVGRVYSR
ncbi:MAG: hypothetical protein FD138_2987 [Planctomycetota bacterium]|nr:MAG: hypothetical protein FD138_2987 [Planctomycetota bacterium]